MVERIYGEKAGDLFKVDQKKKPNGCIDRFIAWFNKNLTLTAVPPVDRDSQLAQLISSGELGFARLIDLQHGFLDGKVLNIFEKAGIFQTNDRELARNLLIKYLRAERNSY